jgi:nicotinate-nucleotide pyrophosphorylase (carboxylating)
MDYFSDLEPTVTAALNEDVGDGDITASLINSGTIAKARVITRQAAVVCGRPWVDEVFRQVDDKINVAWSVDDGENVSAGDTLFVAEGAARALLTAERTALNYLQLLSGTATRTRQYADLIRDTDTKLLDTRKTIPGLRLAQKYAVMTGGGCNH